MNKQIIQTFFYIFLSCILTVQLQAKTINEKFTAVPHEIIDLSNLKGQKLSCQPKLIILHFWATWCPKCHAEMPQLDKIYEHYEKKGVTVIAPTIDIFEKEKLAKYYQDHGITHLEKVIDPNLVVAAAAGIKGVPITLFINSKSEVIGKAIGPIDWNIAEFDVWYSKLKLGD